MQISKNVNNDVSMNPPICKWELRSQERRVARSVPNIFYKLTKFQIEQIQNSACISLRKCKTKYTAGDLKLDDYVNKLIHQDEGFRVLRWGYT